ncbi:MAG: pdp protein [Nautilia sp.]|nr:MAG: pdp protein [Nautilia sp.]
MKLLLFLLIPFFLFADNQSVSDKEAKLVNCYKIFEQRRGELELELEKIAEERQAFQALKDATLNIIKKKQEKLKEKEREINQTLQKIENIKKENEELVKKYQNILKEIKSNTASKLVQSYSKMRAGNAAQILADMDTNSSLEILSKLSPKVLSKIFAKMDPQKAAFLTEKLKNYIPVNKEK